MISERDRARLTRLLEIQSRRRLTVNQQWELAYLARLAGFFYPSPFRSPSRRNPLQLPPLPPTLPPIPVAPPTPQQQRIRQRIRNPLGQYILPIGPQLEYFGPVVPPVLPLPNESPPDIQVYRRIVEIGWPGTRIFRTIRVISAEPPTEERWAEEVHQLRIYMHYAGPMRYVSPEYRGGNPLAGYHEEPEGYSDDIPPYDDFDYGDDGDRYGPSN